MLWSDSASHYFRLWTSLRIPWDPLLEEVGPRNTLEPGLDVLCMLPLTPLCVGLRVIETVATCVSLTVSTQPLSVGTSALRARDLGKGRIPPRETETCPVWQVVRSKSRL